MPVLGTKLHLPSPRRRLVQRARLTDRLRANGGAGPRLVLVAAPAGFGKTTLLAQWLATTGTSQRRVAWLALDTGDGDLRRFLTHLVAAVRTAEPAARLPERYRHDRSRLLAVARRAQGRRASSCADRDLITTRSRRGGCRPAR